MVEVREVSYLASVGAGVFAGASGVIVGHPFDTLKVRLQVGLSNGSWTIKNLYKGLLPPLLTAGVIQSMNFSLYEHFRQEVALSMGGTRNFDFSDRTNGAQQRHFASVFYGGCISGILMSVITTPVSFLKVRQQLASNELGLVECAKGVYNSAGLKGFYRGYSLMLVMNSFGRGVYLLTYEFVKVKLTTSYHRVKLNDCKDDHCSSLVSSGSSAEMTRSLPIRMLSAATAGCFSWAVIYPCDVIKSRMQLDLNGEKYKSAFDCLLKTYSQGGSRALYRGIGHTMVRAAPVAATILPVYDYSKMYLSTFFVTS